eukprot:TRINITY_DN3027_c1_g2_i3.p1 TRINITY_DN3027_c1_g2~~TRINITY_DN3027_c1_g2_i3.p1  ORF type:complete len:1088 (-),score=293.87 TRINITY_DN3027_c1_g2_i3:99-3362(-)
MPAEGAVSTHLEAGGGACSSGAPVAALATLHAQVANVAQETAEVRALADKHEMDGQAIRKATEEAECRVEQMMKELEELRQGHEESAFVQERTAAFTDRQGELAASIIDCLGRARAKANGLAERLAARGVTAGNVRSQVRRLAEAVEETLPRHAAGATQRGAAAAASAAQDLAAAQGRAQVADEAGVVEQEKLIGGLASSLRQASSELLNTMSEASRIAREAASEERDASTTRFGRIAAAAGGILSTASDGAERMEAAIADGDRMYQEQVTAMTLTIASGAESQTAAAEELATGLQGASALASENLESATAACKDNLSKPLEQLTGDLRTTASSLDSQLNAVSVATSRCVTEGRDAERRRMAFRQALNRACDSASAAAESGSQGLRRSLCSLEKAAAQGDEATQRSLDAASAAAADASEGLSSAAKVGHGATKSAFETADQQLGAAWQASKLGLASLGARLTRGGEAAAAQDQLLAAASLLAELRVKVSADVETLRRQRASEERITSAVRRQQAELKEDIDSTRSALTALNEELEAARAAVVATKEGQEAVRNKALDAVVAGTKSTLLEGMQGLGEALEAEGLAPARQRLAAAEERLNAAESCLKAAEVRACRSTGDTVFLLQDRRSMMEEASSKLEELAGTAAGEANKLSAASADAVEKLSAVRAAVEAAQERARGSWATSRAKLIAAALAASEGGVEVSRELFEATRNAEDAKVAVAMLREEASQQRGIAERFGEEILARDVRESSEFRALVADATAPQEQEGQQSRQAVQKLAEALIAESLPGLARCRTAVDTCIRGAAAHAEGLREPAWASVPATLARIGDTFARLEQDVQVSAEGATATLGRLRSLATQAAQDQRQVAVDGHNAAHREAAAAVAAADAQLSALSAASRASSAVGQDDFARVVEAACGRALSASEATVAAARARAREERNSAVSAVSRQRELISDLGQSCSSALERQLAQVRDGLAVLPFSVLEGNGSPPSKAAKTTSDLFADGCDVLPPVAAAALRGGLPPRPSAQALLAEFRNKENDASVVPIASKTHLLQQQLKLQSHQQAPDVHRRLSFPAGGGAGALPRTALRQLQAN